MKTTTDTEIECSPRLSRNSNASHTPEKNPIHETVSNRRIGLGAAILGVVGLSLAASSASADNNVHAPGRTFPAAAAAQAASRDVKLSGPVHWTAVSGYSGWVRTLGNANDYQAMWGVGWYEHKDEPCKAQAHSKHVNDWQNTAMPRWNECSGSPKDYKVVSVGTAGSDTYATSIQVCTSGQSSTVKRKVKGIKLWGRDLNKSSLVLTAEGSPGVREHTNCKVWHAKRSCPTGMVASKVRLHRGTTDGKTRVKGIALGCRKLVRK